MNKDKKIQIISVLILIFLSILMPVVLAKGFSHVPINNGGNIHQRNTPFSIVIDGKANTIFCKEYLGSVGLGNISNGQTMDSVPDGIDYRKNASKYDLVATKDLPKFWAYLLTEDKDVALKDMTWNQQRLIQIALWCDMGFNEGASMTSDPEAYKQMLSYEVYQELQRQAAQAAQLVTVTENLEDIATDIKEHLKNKYTFNDIKFPWTDNTINEIKADIVQPHIKQIKDGLANDTTQIVNRIESDISSFKFDAQIQNLENIRTRELGVVTYEEDRTQINEYYLPIINAMTEITKAAKNFEPQINFMEETTLYITGSDNSNANNIALRQKQGMYNIENGLLDQIYAEIATIRDTPDSYIKRVPTGISGDYDRVITVPNYSEEYFAREKIRKTLQGIHDQLTNYNKLVEKEHAHININIDNVDKTVSIYSLDAQYDYLIETARHIRAQATSIINQINKRLPELIEKAKQELEEAVELTTPMLGKAKAYEMFYKNYISEDGTETGKDTNYPNTVADLTNKEEVEVLVDQNTQTYTIGPFSMQYPSQYYEKGNIDNDFDWIDGVDNPDQYFDKNNTRTYFDWIEDIYLIDKNGNKKENIQIVTEDKDLIGPENNAPMSTEKFWIKFQNEGDDGGELDLQSAKVRVKFRYLRNCLGKYDRYEGWGNQFRWVRHVERNEDGPPTIWYEAVQIQDYRPQIQVGVEQFKIPLDFNGEPETEKEYWDNITPTSVYDTYELELYASILPLGMEIGGIVFEDAAGTKEMITNGIYVAENKDVLLPGIEVRLYEFENGIIGNLAKLATEESTTAGDENTVYEEKNRQNPTLTDENGRYLFKGVDPMKKYVVMFTYNGQTYMPVDYKVGSKGELETEYDSVSENPGVQDNYNWRINSKSTETITDRNNFDNGFAQIGSSPESYKIRTKEPLESSVLSNGYNKTYSEYELAGITLQPDGTYSKDGGMQLIDTYLTITREGTISDTKKSDAPEYSEGLITNTIRNYISNKYGDNAEHKYPTDMKKQIYQRIVDQIGGDKAETWRKLQFIEDCKINAYTGNIRNNNDRGLDVYPIYERFVIDTKDYIDLSYYHKDNKDLQYGVGEELDPKLRPRAITIVDNSGAQETVETVYKALYNGQYYLNLGLGRRQKFDAALRKDVFKATLKINGRTEVYDYNERDMTTEAEKEELKNLERQYGRDSEQYLNKQQEFENRFWEIQTRMIGNNYNTYYGETYSRELYPSERNYTGDNQLEAYITYKITVRNQSEGILANIDEIVDYYDSSYEFMPNLSWAMWKDGTTKNIKVTDQEYYDIMTKGSKDAVGQEKYRDVASNGYNTKEGQYNSPTRFNLGDEYKTLYVDGLKKYQLGTGETEYLYLTFKINGNGPNLDLSRSEAGKQNVAEINGYTTWYQDNTELPNGIKKGRTDSAGLIDYDSKAGNFDRAALDNRQGTTRYEQNFEDDADRARGLKVYVKDDLIRIVSGTVWEDKRNYQAEGTNALAGNGVRETGEATIQGIRVELHEIVNGITSNDIAKVWDGNAWVEAKATTGADGKYEFKGFIPGDYIVRFIYGGEHNSKYNGQDYKSTSYQYDHAIKKQQVPQSEKTNGRTDISGDGWTGYSGYDVNNSKHNITSGHQESGDQATNQNRLGYNIYMTDTYVDDRGNKINVSDARDIWENSAEEQTNWLKNTTRKSVNANSSNNYNGVTNKLAQALDNERERKGEYTNTQMRAETGAMRIEFEYNRQTTAGNNTYSNNGYRGDHLRDAIGYKDSTNNTYHIEDVDFGLEERPKAQLELNKKVSNVKITLANQTVLFDASKSVSNLIWQPKSAYNVNSKKQTNDYNTQGPNMQKAGSDKNVYSDYYNQYQRLRDNINTDLIYNKVTKENGLIQATMDEELMHGATIKITYDLTVTNVGEEDYNEAKYYYHGIVGNKQNLVKTSADVVIDYVANNLQFRKDNNDNSWGWTTIKEEEIKQKGYVNGEVANELRNYNTIITTESLGTPLEPLTEGNKEKPEKTYTHKQLVLSQLITSQNKNDDLSYNNIAEIVQISNDVGRRMAYSVQGNQKPSDLPKEADASKAEQVLILPPFGNGGTILYVALGSLVAAILAAGIVVIKKVVLKTKE